MNALKCSKCGGSKLITDPTFLGGCTCANDTGERAELTDEQVELNIGIAVEAALRSEESYPDFNEYIARHFYALGLAHRAAAPEAAHNWRDQPWVCERCKEDMPSMTGCAWANCEAVPNSPPSATEGGGT